MYITSFVRYLIVGFVNSLLGKKRQSYVFNLTLVGVELMKEFKAEVERMENERQELANAEKLFDLPITMYPELLEVQKDMKGMDQIYNLYDEQKVSCKFVTLKLHKVY